jgi:aspartate aminotransferase
VSLPPLSAPLKSIPHSGIREIFAIAGARPGTIRLEAGQPDFMTPLHVRDAAKRAMDAGPVAYTHVQGMPSLRARLAEKLSRVNRLQTRPELVCCGPGGVGVICAGLAAVTNRGDQVLFPDPGWPNVLTMLAWLGLEAVAYPCPPELGFRPDLDRLDSLIGPRTTALYINTPHNPSGAVYEPSLLKSIGEIAERHNLRVVSDECYDQIMLDGQAVAPGMAVHMDAQRVVSCYTFSKTYAMTGWRVGYATAVEPVVDAMVKVVEASSTCPSAVSQHAAEAALSGPQDCVVEMVSAYRRRRDLSVDILREAGMLASVPEGAFYILADVSASGLDARSFALRLLDERGVGVAPGTAFGQVARNTVRISLASSDKDLREGLGRLCELAADLRDGRDR